MIYHLIYNPTARSGRSKADFEKIVKIFQEKRVDFKKTLTTKKDEAIDIAKNITKKQASVIIGIGGDGTMGEIITGLMKQPRGQRPTLGILHVGTSSDFSRYHKIPVAINKAVDFLFQADTAEIDVGRITYWDSLKKERVISHFGCNVNIGLGPRIASKSGNRYRTYLGNFSGTLLATLISLIQHKESKVTVTIDNKKKDLDNLINLTVGKNPYLASGMRIPVDISADDGSLYYMSIQSHSKMKLLSQLWRLYQGNILNSPITNFGRCKNITISSDDLSTIEFDGDVRGHLPATIKIVPRAIKILKKSKEF